MNTIAKNLSILSSKFNVNEIKVRDGYDDDDDDGSLKFVALCCKQLYFFSGFNSGPVYHLRVVEQKLSFVLNLSKLNLSFVLFASL